MRLGGIATLIVYNRIVIHQCRLTLKTVDSSGAACLQPDGSSRYAPTRLVAAGLTFNKPQNTLPFLDTVTVWGGVPAHANGWNVNRQKHQHLRIDRKHIRAGTDLSCKVGPSDSKVSAAQVQDLSIGGLKFSCDHATIKRIIPSDQQALGLILGVEIVVHFTIKLKDKRATVIKTPARVIHSERLAQDLFHVGVQFLALDITAVGNLEEYLEGLVATADTADG